MITQFLTFLGLVGVLIVVVRVIQRERMTYNRCVNCRGIYDGDHCPCLDHKTLTPQMIAERLGRVLGDALSQGIEIRVPAEALHDLTDPDLVWRITKGIHSVRMRQ